MTRIRYLMAISVLLIPQRGGRRHHDQSKQASFPNGDMGTSRVLLCAILVV